MEARRPGKWGTARSPDLAELSPSRQIAQKAIELGGKYDGHEPPEDVNAWTKTSMKNLAGQGLVVAAKDNYKRDGQTRSFVVGFAEVEVDVETGKYHILEYAAVADVGTVINPRSLKGQTFGGSMLGIGHAMSQKWVYDQHYGVPLAKRFHYSKPPTILDTPQKYEWAALGPGGSGNARRRARYR